MSRFGGDIDFTSILKAAELWRDKCLLGEGGVFSDGAYWTRKYIDELDKYFIQNFLEDKRTFYDKLEEQLNHAAPETCKLAAEMTWVMLLFPSRISSVRKRSDITRIWSWSGEQLDPNHGLLQEPLEHGIGHTGTAYNTLRWRELVFFIHFLQSWKKLESNQQQGYLSDPWEFAHFVDSIEDAENRNFRHLLLFLLFPDYFERIASGGHKIKIALTFGEISYGEAKKKSYLELDKLLYSIRTDAEQKHGTKELDFYRPPLKGFWLSEESMDNITKDDILNALAEIDENGILSDAQSSTYDLIHNSKRYPPKLVVSLAYKYANDTDEELDRTTFEGGEGTPAFALLRKHGFHVERKDFVEKLITQFIKQSDGAKDQATSAYPKSYCGLKVKVSFGQGIFSKVPWISFLGYGQKTQKGIYPGLLYYKKNGILVLTYGLSETNPPDKQWVFPVDVKTIAQYFNDEFGVKPHRYSDSYVYTVYKVSGIDNARLSQDLDKLILEYQQIFESGGKEIDYPVAEPNPTEPTIGVKTGEKEPCSIDKALDGLFIERERFQEILDRFNTKKNLILQGPPGVGKTYFSKRLAWALMGFKVPTHLEMVQFHQSYSYEDFIQGFRPSGNGFVLKNGVFYRFCKKAAKDPSNKYVFIIDEINRGNLSKVFGELMMLIEHDKRGPDWGMSLTYADENDEKFYVPENLYLMGLMNTADRSLAMVDYALRRRFSFIDLEAGFGTNAFKDFLIKRGASQSLVDKIKNRMAAVNDKISRDTTNLGAGYCVGHSFFCSIPQGSKVDETWYRQVVETEIAPLLREYWFDDLPQAESLINQVLLGD